MADTSKKAIIARYTDKSRYKPEYIYGDVYVDEDRIILSKKNKYEEEIFTIELNAAKRFSIYLEKNTNPDAITLDIFIDFKQTKGTNTSVTRQLERGIGQADAVLLILKIKAMKHNHDGFVVIIENFENNYKAFIIKKGKLSVEKNFPLIARRLSSSGN
ncbi:MAG: hypothetical protein J6W62_01475 [Spirochaetia bacterium]|nr:hypothetical protein [Spirochaetia bacterium]